MVRCVFFAVCFTLLAAINGYTQQLRVGVAAVDITPPLGTPMAGYYHARGATEVHDRLFAKAMVLSDGETEAALIGLDLIRTSEGLVAGARRLIERSTGIEPSHVMIFASHTHTGPEINPVTRRHEDSEAQQKTADYVAGLPDAVARAVAQAQQSMQPVSLSAAVGHESSIAFNRRFHMRDGSVGWNPGKGNPEIVKPAGPVDTDVAVVAFDSPDGEPLASFVNYAVHLDNVGGAALSADLPYWLGHSLKQVYGADFFLLYATGCCGDVNHIDVHWPARQKGHENAARMGIILAGEVLRLRPRMKPVSGTLHVRRETVSLPLPEITDDDVRWAEEIAAQEGQRDRTRQSFMDTVRAFKILDVADRKGKPLEVEVQVVTLGTQLAWVALPGEVFAELGLALKQDSPFPTTMIAELANGSIGYIPSRRAYPQGNYEVVSARCAAGSGEMLVEKAVAMLKSIYTEQVTGAGASP